MELRNDNSGVGLLEGLRNRGFWAYFAFVAILVFVLLTIVDLVLRYMYGQNQPRLNLYLVWDIGINIAISLLSAGIAWKSNGERWINRPDTIKLDLDE
ncbi:MAG: hypothetical protein AAB288_02755 [Acidobacteriota bacterium]